MGNWMTLPAGLHTISGRNHLSESSGFFQPTHRLSMLTKFLLLTD